MPQIPCLGTRHRMPVAFGPSPGPRQGPQGQRFDMSNAPRTTTSITFLTDERKLQELLPAGCTLDGEPLVTVEHSVLRELQWLAGRGYTLLGVKFPVRYQGGRDAVRGPLMSVLWENRVEPILTGREELGYPKLYCELPEARVLGGAQHLTACWDGHTFIRMEVGDLQEAQPPGPPGADGLLVHRYLPGMDPQGPAAVDEMAMSPFNGASPHYLSFQRGSGSVQFIASTWEQLPTMFHIVNTLAELPIVRIHGASVACTRGSTDLGNTRSLH